MKTLILFSFLFGVVFMQQAQDFAIRDLEASPRHHEWVTIPAGDRQLKGFVAYPEVAEKATAIIVIHENRGLTDWVRSMADQLAKEGLIALAPDLLSDFKEGIESTSSIANADDARNAMKAQNMAFKYEIYPGAGHAYMRSGNDPDGSDDNKQAKIKSMERIRSLISGN